MNHSGSRSLCGEWHLRVGTVDWAVPACLAARQLGSHVGSHSLIVHEHELFPRSPQGGTMSPQLSSTSSYFLPFVCVTDWPTDWLSNCVCVWQTDIERDSKRENDRSCINDRKEKKCVQKSERVGHGVNKSVFLSMPFFYVPFCFFIPNLFLFARYSRAGSSDLSIRSKSYLTIWGQSNLACSAASYIPPPTCSVDPNQAAPPVIDLELQLILLRSICQ